MKILDSNQRTDNIKNSIYWLVIVATVVFIFRITQNIPVTATINTINP